MDPSVLPGVVPLASLDIDVDIGGLPKYELEEGWITEKVVPSMIVEPLAGIEADPALDVTLAGVVELLAEFEDKGISVVSTA